MASAVSDNAPRSGLAVTGAWVIVLGMALLAIPTIATLGEQVWSKESGAHGPIVLVTGLWLLWRKRDEMRAAAVPGSDWLTIPAMTASLALYVFGRAYDFISLEVVGLYGVGLSLLYACFGLRVLLTNWFPLFYLAFLVPPPGWFMDSITAPLKLFVSFAATEGLQAVGIPVFREGVTLMIGHYQLLVEDACSGMNSITGLVAISLFYIYLLRNASWRYSLFLVALVIPIAIVANIIRIVVLVLLTYFFGDAVAQGFLHMAAGIFLFVTALLLVFAVDNLMSRLLKLKGAGA
ncbi:exosortase V [Phenylobacterium sp.]|uniref:exosortase V n=1 Tax=Phenylobacterium sp. TaxID=1871053 RepID=UPI0035AE5552